VAADPDRGPSAATDRAPGVQPSSVPAALQGLPQPLRRRGRKGARVVGVHPVAQEPVCAACCDRLPEGGATVDIAVVFADVRDSTGLWNAPRHASTPRS
jgi:hypothetical protein